MMKELMGSGTKLQMHKSLSKQQTRSGKSATTFLVMHVDKTLAVETSLLELSLQI